MINFKHMKKVGVLRSGAVGQALAKGFVKYKCDVMVETNHPDKLQEFINLNPNIQVGSFGEAADFGDLLVLCVKGSAAEELVKNVKDKLAGKTIIDTTNP